MKTVIIGTVDMVMFAMYDEKYAANAKEALQDLIKSDKAKWCYRNQAKVEINRLNSRNTDSMKYVVHTKLTPHQHVEYILRFE